MKLYQPKTKELLSVGLAILEQGENGIHCFISDDNQHLVAIIETKLGFKRIKYQATNTQDVITLEKSLAKAIQKQFIENSLITVNF